MTVTDEEFSLESMEIEENNEGQVPVELFTKEETEKLQFFKLMSGEEILGILVEVLENYYIIKRPMLLSRVILENGSTNLMLSKWSIFSNATEQLVSKTSVITLTPLLADMAEFYFRSVANELKKEEQLALGAAAEFLWPAWMDDVIASNDKSKIH